MHFADVQVFIESDTTAHAYLAVELTSLDRESGHSTVDSRDASVSLAKRDGEWVITAAESKEMPPDRGLGQRRSLIAVTWPALACVIANRFVTVRPSSSCTGAAIDTSLDPAPSRGRCR